jgi:hypothetical protein
MEKKTINIVPKANLIMKFQGNDIEIKPYISNELKTSLIQEFVNYLFGDDNILNNYLVAGNVMVIRILKDCCVSIDFEFGIDDDKDAETINNIYASGLWDLVRDHIDNFESFREELEYSISFVQKEKYSFKELFKYISEWVDKELSSDKLKMIANQIDEQKKSLSEVIPIIKTDEVKPEKKIRKSKKVLLD